MFNTSTTLIKHHHSYSRLSNHPGRKSSNRTCKDRLVCLVALSLVYAVLFGLAVAWLELFMWKIIDADKPYLTGSESSLGNHPGLSMVPVVDFRSNLIAYRDTQPGTYTIYADALLAYLHQYEYISHEDDHLRDCLLPSNQTAVEQGDQLLLESSCDFDLNWGHRCNMPRQFGYTEASPCIILVLNKIYGWLPPLGPDSLGIEVCCHGASLNDAPLVGTLCMYDALVHDESGCQRSCGIFPHQYFPYLNQKSYRSPLVFLEVRYPRRNVLINIKCEVTNLPQRPSIEFSLLID